MKITKEKLLADVEDLILTLKKPKSARLFVTDIEMRARWQEKWKKWQESIQFISSEDKKWLDTEYNTWYKKTFPEEWTE